MTQNEASSDKHKQRPYTYDDPEWFCSQAVKSWKVLLYTLSLRGTYSVS